MPPPGGVDLVRRKRAEEIARKRNVLKTKPKRRSVVLKKDEKETPYALTSAGIRTSERLAREAKREGEEATKRTTEKIRKRKEDEAFSAGVQIAGVPIGIKPGLYTNLGKDAIQAALGFPAGVVQTFTHPIRTGEQIAESYAHTYGPLTRGDFGEFSRRVEEHPLGPLLDLTSLLSAGAAAGSKAGLIKAPPTERFLNLPGTRGSVQLLASPATSTRIVEKAIDRLSEARPDLPVIGARARIARKLPGIREIEHERAASAAIPFEIARRKLTPAQNYAYDVIRRYGDEADNFMKKEIVLRKSRLASKGITLTEKSAQRKQLFQLRLARKHVVNPSKRLQVALAEGRKLADITQETKIATRQLTPKAAEEAIHRSARLASGAKFKRSTIAERLALDPKLASSLEGRYVRPRDRNNIGRIIAVDGEGAAVHFHNRRTGLQETKRFGFADLVLEGEKGGKFVGAEGVRAGEGAFFGPDISRSPLKSLQARKRAVTGKPRPLVFKSEGILFTQGRFRRGTKLTSEDFRNTTRYRSQMLDIQEAERFSKALNKEIPGGLEAGHRYFNPEGVKLPRRFRDESIIDELADLTPSEVAEAFKSDYEALIRNVYPDEATVRNLPPAVAGKVRQIDEKIVRAFEQGKFRHGGWGGGILEQTLGQLFDLTNNITKSAVLYLKGSYIPLNFIGAESFAVIQQGPWHAPNMLKAVRILGDLRLETLRRLDIEAGTGAAIAIAGENRGLLRGVTQKLAQVSGAAADKLPRRTAIIHEAAKRGFKTDAQITRLLDNPALRPTLNQIAGTAENAMVRFRGMSQFERSVISRGIFIYAWLKGSTRYGLRLPLDRPLRADFIAHIGEQGYEDTREGLGELASYFDQLVPFGDPFEHLGTTVQKVRSAASVTPTGQTAEALEAAAGAVTGGVPASKRLIGFASPAVKTPFEVFSGFNTFTGRPYPARTSTVDILKEGSIENYPIKQTFDILRGQPQTEPFSGSPATQRNFVEEGGTEAALKQFFMGSGRERLLNLPAARAKGKAERRALMSPQERAKEDLGIERREIAKAYKSGAISKRAHDELLKTVQFEYEQTVKEAELKAEGKSDEEIDRQLVIDYATAQGWDKAHLNRILEQVGYAPVP